MRFDLTNASYRVLDRASKQRLPAATSEISAAKILIALFEEEECRAADWLGNAGLSLEQFQTAFGIREQVEKLQSPISAPSFPVGSYGVPAGLVSPSERTGLSEIKASPAGNNAPAVGQPNPEPFTKNNPEQPAEPQPENEPDTWFHSDTSPQHRTYSIHSQYQNSNPEPNLQSRIRFYLDDQPVHLGRVSKELELTLEIILHRLTRQDIAKRPILTGGGITAISNRKTASPFSLATEHLLLAAVLDESDVGSWLRDHGFDPTELYQRIEGIGHEPSMEQEPITGNESTLPLIQTGDSDVISQDILIDGKVYRLLDAAANRGKEAVRVIEDFVRFVLDNPVLTRQLKDFRHEFQEILESFPIRSRLNARNTEQDVGTTLEGNNEYRRDSVEIVLAANFGRLQESLRSLEEFSKLVKPAISRRFEQLRYQCYTLQKVITLTDCPSFPSSLPSSLKPDLHKVRLYALVAAQSDEETFATFIRAILDGGVDMIQLRDKTADDRTLLRRSRILKEQIVASGRSVLFIMNDRVDLALLAEADGVHVGQDELPVDAVRQIVGAGGYGNNGSVKNNNGSANDGSGNDGSGKSGSEMLIGVSTHNIEQARQAVLDGADYIGAGPTFETPTKSFSKIAGLDYLREVATEIRIPAFAIGGITADNLETVLATGIERIAVGSVLLSDPQKTTSELSRRLGTF
ncbi:MAG: thiamine phosphate synthase [Planctomycetaceae bacterium]|jgi:thiamine-phosphate pyrophosphorylase|nr:thiamine phosphate synthase [Planctomycetaceae bacterium]